MPFLVALLVIALIIAFLFLSTLFIVPQQQAYIIERFGKFNKVQFAGIHIRIPFVDRIAMKTNMRVNQLNVQLETKTLDNVFVTVVASTQFRVNPENVATAYYELRDPAGQLRSYMEDALRSAIPALSLDDAFARKDDVAFDVQKTVGNEMSRFGFTVVKTLITAIDPSPQVKNAMDSINAAQREKEATRQRAEAQRIQIETQAAAEAEKTRLQGEGQANYRREIANGIVDQIKSLQAVGMNIGDVNNVVLFNQYLDVLRSLSESNNSKTVVLPASTPGGYQDMYSQITQAMVTANETAERSAYTPKPSHTAAPSAACANRGVCGQRRNESLLPSGSRVNVTENAETMEGGIAYGCVAVPRRTSCHGNASGRYSSPMSAPWAGMDGRSASCCFTDWICFCRSMTFFSSHAMVMDWEMTSRSR